jgi:Domain of unknown function (DUF4281)
MNYEAIFGIANPAASLAWVGLILLPRWKIFDRIVFFCLIPALCFAYSSLILVHFFRVEGGGFGSLAQVKVLFSSDPVLLAGWIHYLAFDLFVGRWIASEADKAGISRLIQAPILVATFLFGPLGLLLFFILKAGMSRSQVLQGKTPS